jgi:hypothetical protein
MSCPNCKRNERLADRITQLADSIVVGGLEMAGVPEGIAERAPKFVQKGALKVAKKARGPSAYNKRYAAEYKKLKKAHPRSSFAALAKKAHKAARK